jgi:hypothetical protein
MKLNRPLSRIGSFRSVTLALVETTDGHRVEMGPGDASLGEDQGSKPDAAGHVGHPSGTLGDAPITLMFVQLDHEVTLDDACRDK